MQALGAAPWIALGILLFALAPKIRAPSVGAVLLAAGVAVFAVRLHHAGPYPFPGPMDLAFGSVLHAVASTRTLVAGFGGRVLAPGVLVAKSVFALGRGPQHLDEGVVREARVAARGLHRGVAEEALEGALGRPRRSSGTHRVSAVECPKAIVGK